MNIAISGWHVGNGMVSPDDLQRVWQGRLGHYQQLVNSGLLNKEEKAFVNQLIKNHKKEPVKIKISDLNGKDLFKAGKKIGSSITFNAKKLAKTKAKNTKDALLLILMSQGKRYKAKVKFDKFKQKVKKAIK